MRKLCFILADQLSHDLSSLQGLDPEKDAILMVEVLEEATYVEHHKKKIIFLFSAMRHFANELEAKGYSVHYIRIDDPANTGSFNGELARAVADLKPQRIVVTEPGEYRVLMMMNEWSTKLGLPVDIHSDDRFLCTRDAFHVWAQERKQLRMEFFYRDMRKKYNILMSDGAPVGGQWNYDADNRKPPKSGLQVPPTYISTPDAITREVMSVVAVHFSNHFGDCEPFHFAVTRAGALLALRQFIDERLIHFGDYQDAMIQGEPWMYHAHIGLYLNCGLLGPLECIVAAQKAYEDQQAPINAVEGFIRQILGWREYVRGIYWLKMPEYADENFFEATRDLPDFYWTGDTKMNCLKQCVKETKENAYAHHIQRLMVLGNFALIAGLAPNQVNAWFLSVYADAYEWVELPNVTGMILFADGGYLASKPYAAGGSYIHKMSNYCKSCDYKVSVKNGADACPFNYLYWDFLARNRDKLGHNHRVAMMYKTYDRMGDDKKALIEQDSADFLAGLSADGSHA